MPEDLLDVDLLVAVLAEVDLDVVDFIVDVRRVEADLMIAKGESSFLNYGLTLCPADGEREQTKRLIRPVVADAHGKQRTAVLLPSGTVRHRARNAPEGEP